MTEATDFQLVLSKLTSLVAEQKHLIWAINKRLSYRTLKTMANTGLQNAQAAVMALQAFQVVVIREIATLEAAAANATGDADADVQTLADQVNTSIAAMKAALPPNG